MKRLVPILVGLAMLFNLYMVVFAADAPKFSELSKFRLLSSYKDAVIANQQLAQAQAAVQASQDQLNRNVAAFHALEKEEVKAAGFPEGTTVNVDIQKGEVTAVLPRAEEKKPAEKPAEKKPEAKK